MSPAPGTALPAPSWWRRALLFAGGDAAAAAANLCLAGVLLARLDATSYGTWLIAQAAGGMLIPVILAGMTQVATPRIAADPACTPALLRRVLLLRLAILPVVVLVLAGLALHAGLVRNDVPGLALAYAATAGLIAVQLGNRDFALIGLGHAGVLSTTRALSGALSVLGVLTLISASSPAWHAIAIMTAGSALGFAAQRAGLVGFASPAQPTADAAPRIGVLARLALPATAAGFLQLFSYNLDAVLLSACGAATPAEIGDYATMSKLMQYGTLPLVAVLFALAPEMARQAAANDRAGLRRSERRLRTAMIGLGILGGFGIALLGPWLLPLIAGRTMPHAAAVAPWFALGFLLIGVHSAWTATLPFLGDVRGTLLSGVLTAGCAAILVPLGIALAGLHGAALGSILAIAALAGFGAWRYPFARAAALAQPRPSHSVAPAQATA